MDQYLPTFQKSQNTTRAKVLLVFVIISTVVLGVLWIQRHTLQVRAQTPPMNTGNQQNQTTQSYTTTYASNEKYFCKEGEVWQENVVDAALSKGKVASCKDTEQICYSLDNKQAQTYSAKCLNGGGGTGQKVASDIASCTFYRGDQNPVTAKYKSQKLASYFKEASQKSGVPTALLAAIARVESPTIVNYTDQNLTSFGCPTSPTGALGLMQLQPPGTLGSYADGLAFGASYLGKTVSQLTNADFCDLRSNIFLAAGFTIKKTRLSTNAGSGTMWDPKWTGDKNVIYKVASGYYGCLQYGSVIDCEGPYNYGEDLWKSVNSCKADSRNLLGL